MHIRVTQEITPAAVYSSQDVRGAIEELTVKLMAKNPFHCSSETGASVDTKYPVAVFTFLSSACVWPNVINGSVFSAGLAHMFETMDYNLTACQRLIC